MLLLSLLHEPLNKKASFALQAEHYNRTRQQQVDIGLLAPEEAQAPAQQVTVTLLTCCCYHMHLIHGWLSVLAKLG